MLRSILLGAVAYTGVAIIAPQPAFAQNTPQQDTQQTDQSEEDWRNSRRKRGRDDDIEAIINPRNLGSGGAIIEYEPIDSLPEDSRRHLQRQRAKVIAEMEFGEDAPDVPYEPSEAAKQDPSLAAEEEEAWEVILTDLQGGSGGSSGQDQGQGGPNNVAVAGRGGGSGSVTRGGSSQSASDILKQLKGLQGNGGSRGTQSGSAQDGRQGGTGQQGSAQQGGGQGQGQSQDQGNATRGGSSQSASDILGQIRGAGAQSGGQNGSGTQIGQEQGQGTSSSQSQGQSQGQPQSQGQGQSPAQPQNQSQGGGQQPSSQSQSGDANTPQSVTRGGSSESLSDILRQIRGGSSAGQAKSGQTQNNGQGQSSSQGQQNSQQGQSGASGDAAAQNGADSAANRARRAPPSVDPLTLPNRAQSDGNGSGSSSSASDFLKGIVGPGAPEPIDPPSDKADD